jgi:ABC-type transport system involved in multi-copper enzyme maturation permease subunit
LLGPIFAREFQTVPRRGRHYVTRVAYLGGLWVVALTTWLATGGLAATVTLGDTARLGGLLFQLLTLVQLALLLFFAALGAASAVAREKDRRTFLLLLITDLSDQEIVLGKLFGSLLPIAALALGAVPVLALLTLLGGVAIEQVVQSFVIVLATVLAAGSLGGLVALWRDRTFQSLALTVLFLVLYLSGVRGLVALSDTTWLPSLDPFAALSAVSEGSTGALLVVIGYAVGLAAIALWRLLAWRRDRTLTSLALTVLVLVLYLTGVRSLVAVSGTNWLPQLDPFAALRTVQDGSAVLAGGLSIPYRYALIMLGLSLLLNGFGVWRLRAWNPSGEPIMQREHKEDDPDAVAQAKEDSDREKAHAAPGVARAVGRNPILWREIFTRAYGRRPLLVKSAYAIVLILICYSALPPLFAGAAPRFAAAYGLLPISVLSLLLVSAQAATAITSERDTGALDLLLVTDLSAQEFIFGKLGGIAYNTKEYLLPPLVLAGIYASFGCLATPPEGMPERGAWLNVEAFLAVVGTLIVLQAFAMMLGIHVALRIPNSQMAVTNTLGTVFFLSVGTLVCVALILINRRFEYQWTSFVFFVVAGIGGLWLVFNAGRPSGALTLAAWFCPLAVLYSVMNLLVAKPGSQESADPLVPFLVIAGAFGFTIAAMLVPLLSEFDVAMGRTGGGAD